MRKQAEGPRSENGAFSADLVVDMQERFWSSRFINLLSIYVIQGCCCHEHKSEIDANDQSFASNCKFISVESLCLLKLAVLKQVADLTEGWF